MCKCSNQVKMIYFNQDINLDSINSFEDIVLTYAKRDNNLNSTLIFCFLIFFFLCKVKYYQKAFLSLSIYGFETSILNDIEF